jgi:CRISPR type I-E-associated protein CasB/Cse2
VTNDGATEASAGNRKSKDAGEHALEWWRYYCDSMRDGHDPAVRARLRRCDAPVDAAAIPAAVSLARRVGAFAAGADDARVTDALNLARVLAHVKEHDAARTPMRAAGWKTFAGDRKESDAGDDRPLLAEARFRRLLTTGPGEEQVTTFVRLIEILGGTVNVAALSGDFLDWSHPWKGDRVRRRWAEEYFAARSGGAGVGEDGAAGLADVPLTTKEARA